MRQNLEKLREWQKRLHDSDSAYAEEQARMIEREKLYRGDRDLKPLVPGDLNDHGHIRKTSHVRNIVFENIESEVSSTIPQPKVTARRKEDEKLAETIEHFLRNELDRLPFERINDMAERIVPMQGAFFYLVEWDNQRRTHDTTGEVVVTGLHPRQIAPQPGIFTSIDDMDWIILKIPTTKEAVRRQYGVVVENEMESEPEVRGYADAETEEDDITKYVGYEKNDNGGIDMFVWCNDTIIDEITDYQARHQQKCANCGKPRPFRGQIISSSAPDLGEEMNLRSLEESEASAAGMIVEQQIADSVNAGGGIPADIVGEPVEMKPEEYDDGKCPYCGASDWTDSDRPYEEVFQPMEYPGISIPGLHSGFDKDGNAKMLPTLIPYFKPDKFPIIIQRSVSVYGQLFGNSDVDVIADQQNTVNRIEQKIIDRIIKAGTRITLPATANFRTDPDDGERWYLQSAADKAMIDVYDFSGDISQEFNYLSGVYEEARQALGITDSFQGRRDSTATSGKAKEFAASQTAGRLESKRMMKDAAYADIFEMIFKFWLAYGDEPRSVSYENSDGTTDYEEFNRYAFLRQDKSGNYYWNTDFLFSVDAAASLGSNREAMWQETRLNLQTGAFGDPSQIDTLILFWTKMEQLHYPGAGETRSYLQDKAQQQMQMQQQAMMQQQMMTGAPAPGAPAGGPPLEDIDRQAQAQAARDALAQISGSRNASQPDIAAADRQAKADAARAALAKLSPQGNQG